MLVIALGVKGQQCLDCTRFLIVKFSPTFNPFQERALKELGTFKKTQQRKHADVLPTELSGLKAVDTW